MTTGRKHTPIVSRQQQKLFAMVAAGKKTQATGLSKAEAERHLVESRGKDLPTRSKGGALKRRARMRRRKKK